MNDIMTNIDFNPLIVDGDYVIGDSEQQNQHHLIVASKGEYKLSPEIGADILNMLSNDSPKESLIEIKKQLEYDGHKVKNLQYTNGQLVIDATQIEKL